jgi:PepB aminopeptidase
MKVSISEQAPADVWAGSTVSFGQDQGFVHVPAKLSGAARSRAVQAAARKLSALGLRRAELAGDCSDADAWAFAQGFATALDLSRTTFLGASAEWQARHKAAVWLKDVTNATPEDLSPEQLSLRAQQFLSAMAPAGSLAFKQLTGEELRDAGYVGIYHVGRGSTRPPVFLEVDYNPTGNATAPVAACLVGKGITFDSGGYSIKESVSMLGMKCDMGGAALVTASLGLAITQGLKQRVKLFLCCAENLISGHAYKLGDVLRYRNGLSVEIVNTDAEGRLVLADGLIDASFTGAPWIFDAGTLTGAAITALGTDYNAVFAHAKKDAQWYLDIAESCDELHWQLPLESFHQGKCPSAYANTANSRPVKGGGPGGASNAAGFLSRFVPTERHWIHLDLAAAFADSDGPLWAAGATAQGLRTLTAALLKL